MSQERYSNTKRPPKVQERNKDITLYRVTILVEEPLLDKLDAFIGKPGYGNNRSSALRAMIEQAKP